jgi:hypothetical protein
MAFIPYEIVMVDREIIREVDGGGSMLGVIVGIVLVLVAWVAVYLFVTGGFGNEALVGSDPSEMNITITPPAIDVE